MSGAEDPDFAVDWARDVLRQFEANSPEFARLLLHAQVVFAAIEDYGMGGVRVRQYPAENWPPNSRLQRTSARRDI